MGLLPQYDKTQHATPDGTTLATILFDGLRKAGKLTGPSSIRGWAKHLTLLIDKDAIGYERAMAVCSWYITATGDQYTPVAYSGESFRKKFIQLEAAMQRARPVPVVEIKPGVLALKKRLGIIWPGGITDEDFLTAAQVSLNTTDAICHKIKKSPGLGLKYKSTADHLWYAIKGENFIENWFREVAGYVTTKNVAVKTLTATPWCITLADGKIDNDRFLGKCFDIVKKHCHEPKYWLEILNWLHDPNFGVLGAH